MSSPTPVARTIALALALPVVAALVVTAFAWPVANSEPHEVPVAVAAPHRAPQVMNRLKGPAFELHRVADRAAAASLIEDREVYGALVPDPDGIEVLTATAASPAVARILADLGSGIAREGGGPVTVTDIVPGTPDDPAVAGLVAGALPVVLAGILIAAAASTRILRRRAQVTTVRASGCGAHRYQRHTGARHLARLPVRELSGPRPGSSVSE